MKRWGPRTGREHVAIVVQNMSVPLDRRVWNECTALTAAGYRVSVICPRGPGEAAREELGGVRIHRYAPPPAWDGLAGLTVETAYCWARAAALAARIHRAEPLDALQACNPPDTYWLLGTAFKAIGVRFVFDHHDLCPEIYRTRFGAGGPVLRALLALERATFFAADHVITTNDSYRGRALRRGRRRPDETTVVRSGPRAGELRPGEPDPALRRGHRHLCCYLGIMGHQDGVETVVRAADLIVNEWGRSDIAFALLGYGDTLEDLRRLTTSLGLDDHVAFTGRVGTAEIQRYLATAAVGLSPDPRSPFNEVSTMNKTIEYMACGLPVAAFDLHETRVSAGDAARYAPGDDVRSFAKLVVSLVDDPDLRAEMGRAGRRAVEEGLCWEAQAPAYVGAYDRLFGHGSVGLTDRFDLAGSADRFDLAGSADRFDLAGSADPAVTGASAVLSVSTPSGALVGEESP